MTTAVVTTIELDGVGVDHRALGLGAAALSAAAIVASAASWSGQRPGELAVASAVVGAWAAAASVLSTRPGVRRLGAVAGSLAVALAAALLGWVGVASRWTGPAHAAASLLRPLGLALIPAGLLHVLLALPDGTLPARLPRVATAAGYGIGLVTGLGLWAGRPALPVWPLVLEGAIAAAFGGLASNRRYARSATVDRQRMQWFGCAVALLAQVSVVLIALRALTDWPRPLFPVLGGVTLLLPAGLTAGASRRLVPRADRLLVSTVSLAGLSAVVLSVYLLVVVGLGEVPGSQNRTLMVLSMLAAGIAAIIYPPARDRLSVLANRLVYGEREAPDEALRTFGSRLSRAIPMDELLLQLAESLRKTMGSSAEVFTGTDRRFERVASVPDRGAALLRLSEKEEPVLARAGVVGRGWINVWLPQLLEGRGDDHVRVAPVTNSGELLGMLIVERLATADEFSEEDDRVLTELARQVGLALHNMQLDTALQASLDEVRRQAEELRASRSRIVAAADASRREIERNLHDGAQQHLVAMAVKMRLASQMVDQDSESAKTMLEELRTDLQAAVQELRDLAHGIYPPLLMDRGLEAALSAALTRAALPTRFEAESVGRYPADLEAAVYFCCLEAIQNAGKHAGDGATITLGLSDGDGRLSFGVSDDGAGFDLARDGRGHGFINMADRLGAVGGSLEVTSEPGRGTSIRGWVPVPAAS
jgi:signal transduction histidine kinase